MLISAETPLESERERGATDAVAPLVLCFETREAFLADFADNLGVGALFVPTTDPPAIGEAREVCIELPFCDTELTVPSEVVAVVDANVANLGERGPGVTVRLTGSLRTIHDALREQTGLDLRIEPPRGHAPRRNPERASADADIVIATEDGDFEGQTANLSYAGVLALLPMKTIPVGSEVRVNLSTPMVELELCVDGRVIHIQKCDGGLNAHGIQLHYPAERIDEVMAFIEFLQSFDRARRLANVAGEIDERGLAATVEMFVSTAPSGTLVFTREDEVGKIVFAENFILHCALGMVSGVKALARLCRWTSGRFEFQHDQTLPDSPDEPQPFETAMMMASVQLDELARIGLDTFGPNDVFERADNPASPDPETLTDLEREVLEYAMDGFNVGAIADMVAAPDADILKAMAVLADVGLLVRRR